MKGTRFNPQQWGSQRVRLFSAHDAGRKWSKGFNLRKELYFPPRILYDHPKGHLNVTVE